MVSAAQLNEYLDVILDKKLLSYDKVTRTYQTTAQGLEFLTLYEKMKSLGALL
jgi:predicted transcriptional regulator